MIKAALSASIFLSLQISCGKSSNFAASETISDRTIDIKNTYNQKDLSNLATKKTKIIQVAASQLTSHSFSMKHDKLSNRYEFSLKDKKVEKRETFFQSVRESKTERFQQGYIGSSIEEEFTQTDQRGLVDILLVVDNSKSMKDEQKNLSSKLANLLTYINDTNWQIAVTTTTAQSKTDCDISLLDYRNTNPIKRFSELTNVGVNGSGNEMGIYQAKKALACSSKPWLREKSTLAVVFVSDEDNCSFDGADCNGKPWSREDYLIDYIEQDLGRSIGVNTRFYGIFSPPDAPCNKANNKAHQYFRLVSYKADGYKRYGDICEQDYSETLERISLDISSLLINSWDLKFPPDFPEAVDVWIEKDGQKQKIPPSQYNIEDRKIVFLPNKAPEAGSRIYVKYVTGSKPKFNSIELANEPAENTITIYVNGVLYKHENYTINGKNIYFTVQPENGAVIDVRYKMPENQSQKFELSGQPMESSISVRIDGLKYERFLFSDEANLISLEEIPPDGAQITVNYFEYMGPQIDYPVPSATISAYNVQLENRHGELLSFQLAGGILTIAPQDHITGESLILSYESDDHSVKLYPLEHRPIDGSVKVLSDNDMCRFPDDFSIGASQIENHCIISKPSRFEISYQYRTVQNRVYLGEEPLEAFSSLRIFIDGEQTKDYIMENGYIYLPEYVKNAQLIQIYLGG